MFLGSVPFSLMEFPKQRLLNWLNTWTRSQVSSAVLTHASWSNLGEFTLNGAAQLFIKELKAAEILVCTGMSLSHNQWESRSSADGSVRGFCWKADCEVYLDCLLKLPHQRGVLSVLSLLICTSACQRFLNPRIPGLHYWSFLSEQDWAAPCEPFPELCCCPLTAVAVHWLPRGAAGLTLPVVNGHFGCRSTWGVLVDWVHSCWCWQLEGLL